MPHRSLDDTIVALSSGSLPSGVAVVRVSGPESRKVLERLAGSVPPERRASLRRIRNEAGETLDRGIVLFFPGPGSATGEDLAEFHLHGGRAVVAAVLEALTALAGVRLAEAGEFTRRAFENGRIDLTEAEGLADLVAAETQAQRRAANAQAGGSLRALYEAWMRRLTQARAMLEASFDFADEGDVGFDPAGGARGDLTVLAGEMRAHLAGAKRGEILRDGFRVAIVGAPNVGKSSLLNALADREVAIVTPIPGTTRDVIAVTLDLGGFPVRLSDTAGLRDTQDTVEAIGIARAKTVMSEADLVLSLVDATEPATRPGGSEGITHVKHSAAATADADDAEQLVRSSLNQQMLTIGTKIDLLDRTSPPTPGADASPAFDLLISSSTGAGMQELVDRIAALAAEAVGDPAELVPMRTRHAEIVSAALVILDRYLDEPDLPPEIGAEILRQVTDRLGALTGRIGVEDLLDLIFSQFCIGK